MYKNENYLRISINFTPPKNLIGLIYTFISKMEVFVYLEIRYHIWKYINILETCVGHYS